MNRQEAIKLAQKIRDIRAKRIQGTDKRLTLPVLLRLMDMDLTKRTAAIQKLVREGYASSEEEIEKALRSKAVMSSCYGSAYCPSAGMSDKKLDPGTHY